MLKKLSISLALTLCILTSGLISNEMNISHSNVKQAYSQSDGPVNT